MAKYYVSAPVDEVKLAQEVRPTVDRLAGRLPSAESLRDVAAERGLDFATMLLYSALHAAPPHREFIAALETQPVAADQPRTAAKVLVVPALFHAHYPEAGADAALAMQIAQSCGFAVERLPVRSVGTVTENAAIINDCLARETHDEFWVFSVSKGSADFRAFLRNFPSSPAIRRIRGWINVCGLANGCPIADYNIATPLRALKYRAICRMFGVSFELMRELSTSHAYWREPVEVPAHIRVFNFMAIPLPSHVQKSVMGRYLALSKLGPNDGMVLCRQAIVDGGPAYPVWGCDHFFRGPQIPPLLYKLFAFLRRL